MQKRKVKDRVHLSMHESKLETLIVALNTQQRVLKQEQTRQHESANATSDEGLKALRRSIASLLNSQDRAVDRILKQL